MGYADSIIIHYDTGDLNMEDVMQMSVGLTPTETPLYASLKKEQANAVEHEWLEKSLTTAQDNAQIEGVAYSSLTPQHDLPSRVKNNTQIFTKKVQVSSTMEWSKTHGDETNFDQQEFDALKKINTDIELAIVRGSKSSGTGSAARRMAGFCNFITANATNVASGTKLTETFYNDMLQAIWEDGGMVDEVYTNSHLKRVISNFTGGDTMNQDGANPDARVVNKVSIYESDFGEQRIYLHRYIGKTANSDSAILFLDSRLNYLAVGEQINSVQIPQTISGKEGVIRGELTLAVKAQLHQGYAYGFEHNG